MNENISIESRRIEKAESQIESFKDSSDSAEYSDKMDCHENPCGFSRNDEVDVSY